MRTPCDDDPEMDDELELLPGDGALHAARGSGELDGVLLEMRELGRGPAPAPSAELEALLDKGLPDIRRRRARRRTAMVGAAVVGAMTVSLTGIAAANDSLPGGSQGVVAGVINGITPFHVHDRHSHPDTPSAPGSAPASDSDDGTSAPSTPRPSRPDEGSSPGLDRNSDAGQPDDDAPPGATPTPTPTPSERDTGWSRPSWEPRESDGYDRTERSPTPTGTHSDN